MCIHIYIYIYIQYIKIPLIYICTVYFFWGGMHILPVTVANEGLWKSETLAKNVTIRTVTVTRRGDIPRNIHIYIVYESLVIGKVSVLENQVFSYNFYPAA